MVEITVNGELIHPNDASQFEIHDANPLLTKAGSYTFDIDVNLKDEQNKKAYRHIDRLNSYTSVKNRSANITVDGLPIYSGTEAILELSGYNLKIQILAGNSDFNYITSQLHIKDLDLGVISPADPSFAMSTLDGIYPEFNGVFCPILTKYEEFPKVHYWEGIANFIHENTYESKYFEDDTKFIFQPYLLHVLDKVIEALGWNLTYNVLTEDEFACRMVVIHGFETLNINEMIPNWSVSDFITEIEKLFNVIFVADNNSKNISIYHVSYYYNNIANTHSIPPEDIILSDEHPYRNFDVSETFFLNYINVKYNFPSPQKYKYADLDEELKKLIQVLEFNTFSDFDNSTYKVKEYYNRPYLFHDNETDTYYVLVNYTREGAAVTYHFEPANYFAHLVGDNTNSDYIELKICPAEMIAVDLNPVINGHEYLMGAALPYARNQSVLETVNSNTEGFTEWITNGVPNQYDSSHNNLYVACYMGWTNVLHGDSSDPSLQEFYNSVMYPQCVTFPYIMQFYATPDDPWLDKFNRVQILKRNDFLEFSFNLNHLYSKYYNQDLLIDTSVEFEFKFLFKNRPDVRSIFNIAGRKFYCKEIIYSFENGHLSNCATGTFFAVY